MGYDSLRNKHLLKFPDGRLMLIAEISDSRTFDWRGRRCWDWTLFHPEGSLFYTPEQLKECQRHYVEHQLELMREHSKWEVENGFAKEYVEPTVESHDYNGTVFPGGSRIKNGRAFYGGRPTKAEEFFSQWGNPETIIFETFDKDMHTDATERHNIMQIDLDDCYREFIEENGKCYIAIR